NFPLPTFHDFYFPEAAVLFLLMAVVVGLIGKFGEAGTVTAIVAGAADFLGAALIIVLARGITVVMKNTYMTDTILHWMENAVSGSSKGAFAVLAFIVNIPIAFLVPSSSGHAALVMPILAPLADFARVLTPFGARLLASAGGALPLLARRTAPLVAAVARSWLRSGGVGSGGGTGLFCGELTAWVTEGAADELAVRLTGGVTTQDLP